MSDSTVVSTSSRALVGGGEAGGAVLRTAWSSVRAAFRSTPRSPAEDRAAYRRLALQLHHDLPRGEAPRSVLLTTATPSPAAAQGSATLAECLADELGRSVLLADANQEPVLTRLLGASAPRGRGFRDLLSAPALGLGSLALPTSHAQVSFLAAAESDEAAVSAEFFAAVQKAAAERHDFLVLAAGPVLTDSLALALAPWVGCVLLVAVEHDTRVADLDAAENALTACGARKLGLLLAAGQR